MCCTCVAATNITPELHDTASFLAQWDKQSRLADFYQQFTNDLQYFGFIGHFYTTFLCLYLAVDRLAGVGAMVWIGLNHLKDGRGWQWSDGAPLSLVNFTTGTDYLFTSGSGERAVSVS